jgi:hypothetical protein
MWKQRMCVTLGVMTVLIGCAENRIGAPAKTIGDSVATFQGYLSKFQDALGEEQDYQRLSIAGTTASRDLDLAWTQQLQVEWTIASAERGTNIFSLLQSEGKDEVTHLLAPASPAAPPASLSLAVDKLVIVATTMKQISHGQSTKASFQEFVNSATEQPAAPNK